MGVILTIEINTLLLASLLCAAVFAGFVIGGYIHSRIIISEAEAARKDAIDFAEYVRCHDTMMLDMLPSEIMQYDKTLNQLYDDFLY